MTLALSRAALVGGLLLLAACKSEPVDLGLFCGRDRNDTVVQASALAYGIEAPPPRVEAIHPLKEQDLFGLSIGQPDALGLLTSDATGALHHLACGGDLCSVQDARKALETCSDQRQCKIVGAVKLRTFYPLYLQDDAGGHVCDPRWRTGG